MAEKLAGPRVLYTLSEDERQRLVAYADAITAIQNLIGMHLHIISLRERLPKARFDAAHNTFVEVET